MAELCREGLILNRYVGRLSKKDEFYAHLLDCGKCRKAYLRASTKLEEQNE